MGASSYSRMSPKEKKQMKKPLPIKGMRTTKHKAKKK